MMEEAKVRVWINGLERVSVPRKPTAARCSEPGKPTAARCSKGARWLGCAERLGGDLGYGSARSSARGCGGAVSYGGTVAWVRERWR